MAYPIEFRKKALEAVRKGQSKKEVSEILGLNKNTLREWHILEEETGTLEKKPLNREPYKIDRDELKKYVAENPFATHIDFGCTESGIRHAKKALGITRRKRQANTKNETNSKGKNL